MKSTAFLSILGLALGCAGSPVFAQLPYVSPQPEVHILTPGGGTYDGPVVNGVARGRFSTGDIYEGEWKNGKPDGIGTMTYMLGGAYEGEWKEGRRDGKGIMTFAGSGRRAEVRFVNDRRVDVAGDLAPVATNRYFLLSDNEPVGSHIRNKVAYSFLPLDKGFDELTPDQQRLVRSYYPALDAGDNPPYPLTGGKELVKLLESMIRYYGLKEDMMLYVAVDADGKVNSVSTASATAANFRDMIAAAAGLLKYKPASCGGQPCPGVVPFRLKLDVNIGRMAAQ